MSILKVQAEGRYSCKPDIMKMVFHFYLKEKTYEETLKRGTLKVQEFIDYLLSKGFSSENYKTLGLNIKENYISESTGKKDFYGRVITEKKLDGYVYSQDLTLESNLDLDLLKVLMTEISKMENYPMLNLYFDIKDKEYAKTEALKDAYNQCKKKAEMLSDISGKKIKDCIEINYNVDTDYRMGANYGAMKCSINAEESLNTICNSIDNNFVDYKKLINPENIITHDSIITIWELD